MRRPDRDAGDPARCSPGGSGTHRARGWSEIHRSSRGLAAAAPRPVAALWISVQAASSEAARRRRICCVPATVATAIAMAAIAIAHRCPRRLRFRICSIESFLQQLNIDAARSLTLSQQDRDNSPRGVSATALLGARRLRRLRPQPPTSGPLAALGWLGSSPQGDAPRNADHSSNLTQPYNQSRPIANGRGGSMRRRFESSRGVLANSSDASPVFDRTRRIGRVVERLTLRRGTRLW